jgi:hypothetical protein
MIVTQGGALRWVRILPAEGETGLPLESGRPKTAALGGNDRVIDFGKR